jgi:cell division septum initiation protein DivIVA
MTSTALLGAPRFTGESARRAQFAAQMLGGYRVADVEAFRTAAATALDQLARELAQHADANAELVREVQRLGAPRRPTPGQGMPAAPPRQDIARSAAGILANAQATADDAVGRARAEAERIMAAARHDAGQLTEHARAQAGELLDRARSDAEEHTRQAAEETAAERAKIIAEASGEAERRVDFLTSLAKVMQAGLEGSVEALLKRLGEWEQQARDGHMAPVTG